MAVLCTCHSVSETIIMEEAVYVQTYTADKVMAITKHTNLGGRKKMGADSPFTIHAAET